VRERRDFLAWAREQAINVDLASPEASALTALDPLLEGKRIVYLGESNHLIHDEVRLSPAVSASSRPRRISVDRRRARVDRRNLDRALPGDRQRGTPRPRGGLRLHRCRPRRSRRCAARGPRRAGRITLRFEQRRFDAALRSLAVDLSPHDPLRFFGFDVDYVPSAGYEIFLPALAEPHAGNGPVSTLQGSVQRVPGESKRATRQRSRRARRASQRAQCCTGEGACPRPATLPSHNRDFRTTMCRSRTTHALRSTT
jgi:hypothetical protein